jgi:hypothetical protein
VRLCGAITAVVPKKPPEKTSSDAQEAFYLISLEGGLYLLDTEVLKGYGHIEGKKEGFYGGGRSQTLIAELINKQRLTNDFDKPELRKVGKVYKIVDVDVTTVPGMLGTPRSVEPTVLDEMIRKVTGVLGSRDEAMRWLGTPVRALNFAIPISLLGTKDDVECVNDVLGQMEYAIW